MDRFNNIDTRKISILIIIAITLLGELYFYPINGEFRFSVSVIAFSLVILLLDDFKIAKLSIYVATSTLLFRSILGYISTGEHIVYTLILNFPSSMYYILFSTLVYFLNLKKNKENSLLGILSLFSIDTLSNIGEGFIRSNLTFELFRYILIIAFIRSLISYGIYSLIKSHENSVRNKEYQERYIQLNNLVSNIQVEMFYLKKSSNDIEAVMSKSYSIYENNKHNKNVSEEALEIARQVHEIKKDYYRVLNGFKSFLDEFETNDSMSLKDIAYIIENNSKRYIKGRNKDINIRININDDYTIKNYYSLFTILNNLIVNSIDSIAEAGQINVDERITNELLVLNILDNGEGIDKDLIPYIFNPGFTTKFDELTGDSSTGIGLSHVKNIVDELDGYIEVKSESKKTEFNVFIPIKSLRG